VSKIAKNMAWLLLSQVSTWAISIVMLVVVPRLMSDTQFGRAEFAFTFVGFFALLAQFGTAPFIVRSTARDPSLMPSYVYNALVMKSGISVVFSGAAVGLAALLGYDKQSVTLVAVCCITMTTVVLNESLVAGQQGRQQMKGPAILDAAKGYLSAGASLIVLFLTRSVVWYTLTLVSAGFLPLIGNFKRVWPEMRVGRRIDTGLWRVIIRGGAPFLMWSAVQLVYGKIDIPLLQSLASSKEVGWYSLAYNWVGMPAFFAAIVSTAFFPSLSEHGVTVSTEFKRLGNQSLRLVMFVTIPAAVGIAVVVHQVFTLLHYSDGYLHAVPLVRILAVHIPIVCMDILLGVMLGAVDRQRQWVVVGVIAAALNPLMNLVAIPFTEHHFHNGAIGASITTVLTELVMMIGAIWLRPAGILDRFTTLFILRCVLASAVMGGAVVLLDGSWLLVRIVAALVIYAMMSLLLRTFSIHRWREDFLPQHESAASVSSVL